MASFLLKSRAQKSLTWASFRGDVSLLSDVLIPSDILVSDIFVGDILVGDVLLGDVLVSLGSETK